MKQRVSSEILEQYYELWLSGATAAQIRKKLRLSISRFNLYTPDFLAYCRHKVKFDTRAQLTDGELPALVKLTPEREAQFLQLISTGLSYDKAALVMNVPLVTVMDYWFKDTSFKAKVDYAIDIVNAMAVQAFYKRVIGYEYDGGHRSTTRGTKVVESTVMDEDGNKTKIAQEVPYYSETTVEKINVIEPDVNAGKFWLINRMPDEFTIDGQRTNRNNKGKILQWIEGSTDLSEKNMIEYDKEQGAYDEKYHKNK